MDTFSIVILGGLAVIFLAFVAIGRWHPARTNDITHKRQGQALGEMARIEERDIPQMVDAHNIYRRRRGVPETTEAEVRARIGNEELQKLNKADHEVQRRDRKHSPELQSSQGDD